MYYNDKGYLSPSDPNTMGTDLQRWSTNAATILKHKGGSILRSYGHGEIRLATGTEVMDRGEKEVLSMLDWSGMYLARCDENLLSLTDLEGNHFSLRGNAGLTFNLAVSMGDELKSPRCERSLVPYKHPDASFLPLPEGCPPPRLFVVYGGGDGEELMVARHVDDAIRTSKEEGAVVTENEALGPPMIGCQAHTIFTPETSDGSRSSLPLLELPPIVAGSPPYACQAATNNMSTVEASSTGYTMFRQFIEYPDVQDDAYDKFQGAVKRHAAWEEEHKAAHEEIGKGLGQKETD